MFCYSIRVVLNLKLNIGFLIVNVHKPTDGRSFFVLKKTRLFRSRWETARRGSVTCVACLCCCNSENTTFTTECSNPCICPSFIYSLCAEIKKYFNLKFRKWFRNAHSGLFKNLLLYSKIYIRVFKRLYKMN